MTRPFSRVGSVTDDLFRSWIIARETKLAEREEMAVCPFEWGEEALASIAGFADEGRGGGSDVERFRTLNERWLRNSAEFFAHDTPTDFALQGTRLRFTSAVRSAYPENNIACAEYFPSERARGRAVLVLPHWNATFGSYARFCRYLNWLGFSALLVTLPYHGERKPRGCVGAEYAVSPNIGRTIACARQGVIDTLSCLEWLAQRGYEQFSIVGSSLGFGHAFVASALDERIRVNVFTHCCSTVSDALWVGMPEYRAVLARHVSQEELRACWRVIHPISYFEEFAKFRKRSLLILGRYDTTFAPAYVEEATRRFREMGLDHRVVELACGHRTIADVPWLVRSAWEIGRFLLGEKETADGLNL